MPPPAANPWRTATALALLVALRLVSDTWTLLGDPSQFWDWEDSYNATTAWLLGQGALWDRLLWLQYRDFCGGCTSHAVVAAPLLALTGDHWLSWKALALAWNAATVLTGFFALRRWVSPTAGWVMASLLALPPVAMAHPSLMLWGNHAETHLWVLGLLLLARPLIGDGIGRAGAFGLVAGLAVWFCRTNLYAVVVLVPLVLWRTRNLRLLVGAALGLVLIALPAASGDHGGYDMSPAGNLLPFGLVGAGRRLWPLVDPTSLGSRVFDVPGLPAGIALIGVIGVGAAVAAWKPRTRPLLALPVTYAAFLAISGFPVFGLSGIAEHGAASYRHAAPWVLGLMVVGSVGLAHLLDHKHRALRAAGLAGLAALLVPAIWGRTSHLHDPRGSDAWQWEATILPDYGVYLAERSDDVPAERIVADRRVSALLSRLRGHWLGRQLRGGLVTVDAVVDGSRASVDPDELLLAAGISWDRRETPDLIDLEDRARDALDLGIAQRMAVTTSPRALNRRDTLRRRLGRCYPMAVGGIAGRNCRSDADPVTCLRDALRPETDPLTLYGAGLTFSKPPHDMRSEATLVTLLGPEFERGLSASTAGLSHRLSSVANTQAAPQGPPVESPRK